jgi:hypothetical protein
MAKTVIPQPFPDLDVVDEQTISKIVKAQRTHLNIPISVASSLCGVSLQAFVNVERGVKGVTLISVLKILKGLGIKIKFEGLLNESEDL